MVPYSNVTNVIEKHNLFCCTTAQSGANWNTFRIERKTPNLFRFHISRHVKGETGLKASDHLVILQMLRCLGQINILQNLAPPLNGRCQNLVKFRQISIIGRSSLCTFRNPYHLWLKKIGFSRPKTMATKISIKVLGSLPLLFMKFS